MPLCQDVIALPVGSNRWILYNAFTRTALGADGDAMKLISEMEQSSSGSCRGNIWEITDFSNRDGLLADPTRILRKVPLWPPPRNVNLAELRALLEKNFLWVVDEEKYRDRFQPKTSLLDHEHFGNFHQQLSQYLFLTLRKNPSDWWANQKFEADFSALRPTLYAAVQEHFLKSYFPSRLRSTDHVYDLGCGTGFYSNLMAKCAASVTGLDPSEAYLEIAKAHAAPNARFEVRAIGYDKSMDNLPSNEADFVFMSDALLFYFVWPFTGEAPRLEVLFRDVRRLLKPTSTFVCLEPHYLFWLAPWLGSEEHPFTVQTEYRDHNFGVVPTLSRLIQEFNKGGFNVSWMEELYPDPKFRSTDSRAFGFANEFPLWHLFELKPR